MTTLTGTIFDIKKYAIHDGPGIRTTVFFKGCPLDCWWCHNPEGRKAEPETFCIRTGRRSDGTISTEKKKRYGRTISVDEVMTVVAKDTVFYDQSGGGVTFSGGEPLMQLEFLQALLMACKESGIHTAVDTCGYAPADIFERIYDATDLFLYDLKLMSDEAHIKYTGVSNRLIRDNLVRLAGWGNKTQVRLPLIPGITDTSENFDAVFRFLEPLVSIREISLLPYNRLAEDKLQRFGLPQRVGRADVQSADALNEAARKFEKCGYRVTIGG